MKTQIWIAVCTYVLVAILRKRLKLEASMHEILQILSLTPRLTLFEKTPLDELLTFSVPELIQSQIHNQLNLLD